MLPVTNYDADVYDVMHPGSLQGDVERYRRKAVDSGVCAHVGRFLGRPFERDGDELVVEARKL